MFESLITELIFCMIVRRMAFSKHILSYLKSRKKQEGETSVMSGKKVMNWQGALLFEKNNWQILQISLIIFLSVCLFVCFLKR